MSSIFEKNTFVKRFGSMLKVDFKRLFLSRAFYIILAICLVSPVLILVMTTMMDGTVTVDAQTGAETVMEGFDNTWQIIGSVSTGAQPSTEAGADSMAIDMSIRACAISICSILQFPLLSVFL